MCGIFGTVFGKDDRISARLAERVIELYRCSQTRGSEAAGLAMVGPERIDVLKQAGTADEFLRSAKFHELFHGGIERYEHSRASGLAVIGHTRLVTGGFQSNSDNNQPVIASGTVGIHNGIIVNDADLWRRHPRMDRSSEVDTEVLVQLLRRELDESGDLAAATRVPSRRSRAADRVPLRCARGPPPRDEHGIAAYAHRRSADVLRLRLRTLHHPAPHGRARPRADHPRLVATQVPAFQAIAVSLADLTLQRFPTAVANGAHAAVKPARRRTPLAIVDHTKTSARTSGAASRCILPESYPFMEFDAQGVCTYCRRWRPIQVKGAEALAKAVEPYRSKDGSPDVIVAFSGGRDSSYGLHYVKTVLGMNPVAFTYDWGMVTDLARRNCARVCGKLGVEHIIRAANITAKRRYVRKNIEAWLEASSGW
jgi:hypothetical protein